VTEMLKKATTKAQAIAILDDIRQSLLAGGL